MSWQRTLSETSVYSKKAGSPRGNKFLTLQIFQLSISHSQPLRLSANLCTLNFALAPENQCLEDYFPFRIRPIFECYGAMLVSGRIIHCNPLPSRKLTYPTLGKPENQANITFTQSAKRDPGYVSSVPREFFPLQILWKEKLQVKKVVVKRFTFMFWLIAVLFQQIW